ncbi:MAG: InlB B-repeat-containing protein [Kiritimatiellae bacterium]|nr:InlB B-repeat-containing protein [Kiritimatiellia bacterium]
MKKVAVWAIIVMLCGISAEASAYADRLSRRSASGRIAVRAAGNRLPGNATVSFARTRDEGFKRRIADGFARRRKGSEGEGASPGRSRPRLLAAAPAAKSPNVLAMYDVSISADGRKWQPAAGEPVQVTVELDEPVTVKEGAPLGVVHLSDDGEVEELDASRYGFTYDATRTAVTAFWFDATGFSVYAITEGETPKTESTPARRLYDFYSLDFNTNSVTWNRYVRRYFTTMEGNTTFRQIVKDGEMLVRPEVLPSPLGRTFMGWHLYDPAKANSTVDGVTYDAEGYATTKFDFTQPIVFNPGETGENEYQLRAVFDRVGYVIFHEQPSDGDWPITAVRRGVMREVATNVVVEAGVEKTNVTMQASVPIADVTVTYDDTSERPSGEENANTTPRMIFRGWSTEKVMPGATTNVLGGPIELLGTNYVFTRTKDTEAVPRNLYPVFVNINWLAFSSGETGQGATYIPPHFFYADEGTNRFPVPSRTGYTFEGWYTSTNAADGVKVVDANSNLVSSVTTDDISEWGGVISNGMLRLTKDTTLYANWEPAPTKYTVVVWQQKSTDAADLPEAQRTYDFVDSYTNLAESASEVSVADKYKNWAGQASNAVHAASYEGFHFGHCDGTTTVNGNGSTVLNVYYDRNVRTLKGSNPCSPASRSSGNISEDLLFA